MLWQVVLRPYPDWLNSTQRSGEKDSSAAICKTFHKKKIHNVYVERIHSKCFKGETVYVLPCTQSFTSAVYSCDTGPAVDGRSSVVGWLLSFLIRLTNRKWTVTASVTRSSKALRAKKGT